MFKTELFLGILIALLGPMFLCAQVDTTLLIQEINISETSIRNKNIGGTKDVIYQGEHSSSQDLTTLLTLNGDLYIKSYGSNSLGTSSIRGGSAGHTLLLWNGVPLQSPTLGLLDFSLIPHQLMDKIDVQKGGNSALWGSGAIGGVINLENKMETASYLSGDLRFGSFGNVSGTIKMAYGNNSYFGKTKVSYTQAENNFKYRVSDQSPLIEQANAGFNTLNINQDLYFNINEKQFLNIHYWWQSSTKEIPATITQNFNASYQDDEANRLMINWNRISDNHKSFIKLAVLDEDQLYVDSLSNLTSNNVFTQWFAEAGHSIAINDNQQLSAGITAVETTAKTNGFSNGISETKFGFWFSHQLDLGKLKIQSSLREEIVEGEFIPIVSRNYRLPTLNDKFWKPGGNQELLPENGWSQELGLSLDRKQNDRGIEIGLTGFNRTIKNWIFWAPSNEFGFWQAQNLTEVWSRGLESSFNYKAKIKALAYSLSLNHNFIKSTNEVAITLPKLAKGEQLIYTPLHQISGRLSLKYKKISLSYFHLFSGENQGVNDAIPAYHVGNVTTNYLTDYKNSEINFFLQVQNIWNARYVVVERRPMPGINFQLGINFTLKKQ